MESRSGSHLPWPESLTWQKRRSRRGHVAKLERRLARVAEAQYALGLQHGAANGLVLAALYARDWPDASQAIMRRYRAEFATIEPR